MSDEQNLPGATPETEPPSNAGVLWNALTRDPSAGVAVCDLDGMVLWVNERGLRMYVGPTATQGAVVGKTWKELGFPDAWIEERLALFREMRTTGEPVLLRTIWEGKQYLAWMYPLPPDNETAKDTFLIVSRESDADVKQLGTDPDTKVKVSSVARLGESMGVRLVTALLAAFEVPQVRDRLLVVFGGMASGAELPDSVREYLMAEVFSRIRPRLAGPDADLRVNLVMSHVVGLILARYVLRLEPLASADPARVVALMGPVIQGYMTPPAPGPLPHGVADE